MGGFSATWVPYLQDEGIAAGIAATSLTIYGFFSFSARFFWGYFAQRHHIRRLLILLMLMASSAMLLLLNVQTATLAIIYACYQGFVLGGYYALNPLIYPTYFGRRFVGTIQGFIMPFQTLASASGPFLFATVFDMTGSYRPVYFAIMITWIVGAALMYLARPLRAPSDQSAPDGSVAPAAAPT
jgi:MFS family permease